MPRKVQREPLPPPKLVKMLSEAQEQIRAQISKGSELRTRPIHSPADVQAARSDFTKWNQFNRELLTRLFDNVSVADEYNQAGTYLISVVPMRPPTLQEETDDLHGDIQHKLTALESILERLPLMDQTASASLPSRPAVKKTPSRDIFVVHGHDTEAKLAVARFLEKLELHPIILHEQASGGRTLIEKVERYSDVAYTVVLLTPDDVGAAKTQARNLKPRARQNVIFELGYFVGLLKRANVCALYKEGVELPTDLSGVVYIPMDPACGWHVLLAREIDAAGIPFDWSKLK